MRKKHFNIPIFIPELACPFQCIYCDQTKISGVTSLPGDQEIIEKIGLHLQSIPPGSEVQLAYFGGNFTGIPLEEQRHYLELATPYIKKGDIHGIRLSTRPDYINESVLTMLKEHHVTHIELGAQSMDEEVLKKSRRGHTPESVAEAAGMIRDFGFILGLQMMIGLPGDTLERSLITAHRIIELGAVETRIYPTLVIRGTALEKMYRQGEYQPLELEEAADWCSQIIPLFEEAGVKVLKVGLHPSDGLQSEDLVAGPFHPSFRELVETLRWRKVLEALEKEGGKDIEIKVSPDELNWAIGYGGSNRKMLEQHFSRVSFRADSELVGKTYQSLIRGERART
jgi:histone acetyltransferase (RNA polymerase elongator complex component)